MKNMLKPLSFFLLIALVALALATPVQAFDGRAGDVVVIAADEVIDDDVYISAGEFTLEGTIKGDLVVAGGTIIINGSVGGDLIAAGQSIIINGSVADDARIAGAVLYVGEKATIGGDLVSAGASLETQDGSKVDEDLVVGAAQALLAGDVGEDALIGTGALDLRGEFGGNVKAEVGDPDHDTGGGGPSMSNFIPDAPVKIPNVLPGLNIAKDAKIKGNFEYTQFQDINIPANVVGGKITRKEPVVDPHEEKVQLTPAQSAANWVFDLLRRMVTLIALGLLLGWLVPSFVNALMEKVQSKPVPSLGWGFVSYAAFFFVIFVLIALMVVGGLFFGALTLGGLSGTIIWVGILAIFALAVGFVLATAFLTKIVVARLGGKLLLQRVKPEMADNKYLPLIVGVVILAFLMAIPFIGWVFSLLAVLAGLGALWMWGSEIWQARKQSAAG